MISKETFMKCIAVLGGTFDSLPKEKAKIYYDNLKYLSESQLSSACGMLLCEYKYKTFPSVADIRYYAGVDLDTMAKMAIVKLKKAIDKVSEYRSLSFSDKALNAVVNYYGKWTDIKHWTMEDWGYKEKAMKELYMSFVRAGVGDEKIKGHDELLGCDYKLLRLGEVGEKIEVEYHKPEQKLLGGLNSEIKHIINNVTHE